MKHCRSNNKNNNNFETVIARHIYGHHSRRMNDSRRVKQNLHVQLMKYSANNQLSQEHQHLRSEWYLETLGHAIPLGVPPITQIVIETVVDDSLSKKTIFRKFSYRRKLLHVDRTNFKCKIEQPK